MAALIKSIAVEDSPLLLGEEAVARVSESPIAAVPPVHGSALNQAAVIADERPIEPVETDDNGAAYRRFMAEHESLLSALEEQTRSAAYEAGYAEGEKAGRAVGLEQGEKQGAQRYADAVAALENLTKSGKESLVKGISDAESLIGAIVFEAVCKIVGDALRTPEGVQAVVEQAVAGARRQEIASVKISPADLSLLLTHEAGLQPGLDRLRNIGLEADESVALGGCIVQLKGGHIDARIETQFRAFAQSLKDAAQERG